MSVGLCPFLEVFVQELEGRLMRAVYDQAFAATEGDGEDIGHSRRKEI